MTNLTYTYQVTSYDAATKLAVVIYTPSINTLPPISRQVAILPTMTDQERQIAISQNAPFTDWWTLDPSTKPPFPPAPWHVTPN